MSNKLDLSTYKGGVLPPPENPEEYIFGGATKILHDERNTTADWRTFLPTDESQSFKYFDDYGCATHSALNSVEIQFQFLLFSNLISEDDIQWLRNNGYFDANGKLNFDDRWIVILSGTRPGVGNYLHAVWDAIRKFGLIPQGVLPDSSNYTQGQYYSKTDFSQRAYDIGGEFLRRFMVQYERITDIKDIKEALKHAPIQVGTATCPGWNDNDIIKVCGDQANHANLVIGFSEDGTIYDYDSYTPFLKRLEKNYKIYFAYKGVLTPTVSVDGKKKLPFLFKKDLRFGDYGDDVLMLCDRLIKENCIGDLTRPIPHFGPEVARGLRNYQRQYKLVNWFEDLRYRGKYFGPKTRNHMNLNANNPKYPW